MDIMKEPWPWYVAGPLIGLIVPVLLLLGNKSFGVSGTLRQICAACVPANISFFRYDWKKESWNLFFVAGIMFGGLLATLFLSGDAPVAITGSMRTVLQNQGVKDFSGLMPSDVFSFSQLLTLRGFVFIICGGFLVGFGTRYAGGCTSGHSIMGLSTLQWPSLVATIMFMAGGVIMANLILPYILRL